MTQGLFEESFLKSWENEKEKILKTNAAEKNVWSLLHSSALIKIVMKQTATNLSLKCREGFGSMHKLLTGFHFCKK